MPGLDAQDLRQIESLIDHRSRLIEERLGQLLKHHFEQLGYAFDRKFNLWQQKTHTEIKETLAEDVSGQPTSPPNRQTPSLPSLQI